MDVSSESKTKKSKLTVPLPQTTLQVKRTGGENDIQREEFAEKELDCLYKMVIVWKVFLVSRKCQKGVKNEKENCWLS